MHGEAKEKLTDLVLTIRVDAVIQNADSVAVAVSVAVSRERDDTLVAERIAVVAGEMVHVVHFRSNLQFFSFVVLSCK